MSDKAMRERAAASTGRNQLFSGATAARMPAAGGSSNGMRDALEADNDRLLSELEGKAAALKNATQMIHDEVSEHNKYLNGMSTDFDRAGNLMGSTLKKLDDLVKYAGGSTHMCAIIAFVVLVFLGLWYMLKK